MQDNVKVYSKEELENQLMFLLIPYYNKKLQYITNNKEIDFKEKTRKIRIIKENIQHLKQKNLTKVKDVQI